MVSGKGIAAARARIEAAFRALHNDCRDREQVSADRELQSEIQIVNEEPKQVVEPSSEEKFEKTAQTYVSAALNSPAIAKQIAHANSVHRVWIVEVPTESAEALIAEALRQMEDD